MTVRWAIEWRGGKRGDRVAPPHCYFMWDGCNPFLFKTRASARAAIKEKYGYISEPDRKDLRGPPHYWKIPRAVKVTVALRAIGGEHG